jgi:alkylation response protein AidB-like acyl-CoA dehydrogenase
MAIDDFYQSWPDGSHRRLLQKVREMVPAMRAHAGALDHGPTFPTAEFDQLRAIGALSAAVPRRLGGLGLGVEADGALALAEVLRLLGCGNLAVGRIFEGHVNALKLIALYGGEAQLETAANDTRKGYLFAIWNTEALDGVRIVSGSPAMLMGRKTFCSAAGYATRGLITAKDQNGMRMLVIPLEGEARISETGCPPHGMRAAITGSITFDGLPVLPDYLIGQPEDYMREPTFSAGAWRAIAVTLGGLEALVEAAREQLIARGRHADTHQIVRMGRAFIARETARLWVRRAALIAETGEEAPAGVTAYVNLARIAVETVVLETIQLVQRSLGLAAFLPPNPVERLMRDLATYLRQPAPDEALTEASSWLFDHDHLEGQWGK